MEIKFYNYLDYDSILVAFENDVTFTMMKKAVKYDIENNIKTLEESNYCYFTPYNNIVNIRYEIIHISENRIYIGINEFIIDNDYEHSIIEQEIDKFKHIFTEA